MSVIEIWEATGRSVRNGLKDLRLVAHNGETGFVVIERPTVMVPLSECFQG